MMRLFLLLMATLAAIIDQRTMRIPNWLSGSLLVLGSFYCIVQDKPFYLFVSIAVLLLFLPFNFGSGDKKLLMAMPLYFQDEVLIYFGIFGLCYVSFYYYFRVYRHQREDKPLGWLILLTLVLTLLRIHCFGR